jgi:WD40 repeat protein
MILQTSDGYDTKNGTNSFVLAINQESAHEGDVNHVEWHPVKDNLLVSCGDDNLIKIWNLI